MWFAKVVVLVLLQLCSGRHLEIDFSVQEIYNPHALPNLRIINGTDAKPHALPSLALILFQEGQKQTICGGSLVDKQFVLTAAHCIYGKDLKVVRIALGTNNMNWSDVSQVVEATAFAWPKEYDFWSSHDIGLIKLSTPANLKDGVVEIIKVADAATFPDHQTAYDDKPVDLYGWGLIKDDPAQSPMVLQTLPGKVVPYKSCEHMDRTAADALCVGRRNGGVGVVCYGDSGSPLMEDGKQIAVVSKVQAPDPNACTKSTISIYTRVDYHRKWMDEKMSELK